MSVLTISYALLFYVATLIFVVGLGRKIGQYVLTPAPLKIPTTPAPTTLSGVAIRMTREVVLFESLYKATKWTWLFGWVFHFALCLVLLQHLRYVTSIWWPWVAWLHLYGIYASLAMLFGLVGLWGRRFFVDRVRYVSALSDHLMLALLIAIASSGMALKYINPADVIAVKAFIRGLMVLDWEPLPANGILLLHLGLVALLIIVFPFSKLLHAPGLFFSPTRYQIDNSRER